ncbi:FAD-linked oxidase [Candidatus Endobugula sertula]|uniref:D-2-hydroxyglutarate dehydrogenase n=1 Tax=Candidatus Endobugula sertula TaxID=62101 RepID=A0A1D2QLK1_9GAMM|nr:FAD-linked oxidase [Candidatus Endobugula sertula]
MVSSLAIPRLNHTSAVQQQYLKFIALLKACDFSGELCPDYANRIVLSTDNSIYQVLPQGVIYPKKIADLVKIAELSNTNQFHDIVLSPRGGGTGTNGQSLTDGLIVDLSRYMNHILEINVEERWVKVQCGVVKDQLNAAVKPYGLFFAPELSTSNRATIGGMINTDASGQGSCAYGKTRNHVLELTTVLLDGSVLHTSTIDDDTLSSQQQQANRTGHIHRTVDEIQKRYATDIETTFPPLNRCLTGYDLAHIRDEQGQFNLNNILCGSEGTLGFIAEAKLNLLPIPQKTALINLCYNNFDTALRDAKSIMEAGPTSIETIDSTVLNLAKGDIIWANVAEFFPKDDEHCLEGVNFVEYTADSEIKLQEKMQALLNQLNDHRHHNISYTIAYGEDVEKIWGMRKKSVGLLGNIQGEARPVPFVEDTAVPPEHLADFIVEFRALLDSYQLKYSMFGHVDAGVLHVRPILDMKDPAQASMVRTITDRVVELTHKYGGLLWGEHGKGVRSEYALTFFGDLYPQIQRIKQAFDPRNQLNPGKIASPAADIPLLKIDEVTTRGEWDREIKTQNWKGYNEAMFCNGNGACHNWNPDDPMCPSWKGTRKRTHTPKGRAALIREWLRQLNKHNMDAINISDALQQQEWYIKVLAIPERIKNSIGKSRGKYDFSHEVHESMMACLACKSCVGQCPVKIDVPEFRSKFLELYYSRYLRPLKDYVVGSLEFMLPIAAKAPKTYNLIMGSAWVQYAMSHWVGLSNIPLLSTINFDSELQKLGVRYATLNNIEQLNEEQTTNSVIIVQDAFTRFFETELLLDTIKLLTSLGFTPWVTPFFPNGKPLHVHGFRKAFSKTVIKTSQQIDKLASTTIPLIGVEPSMTLAYRSEYQKVLGKSLPVMLIQEWLATQTDRLNKAYKQSSIHYKLLAHCTEKTNASDSINDWQSIFMALGHQLDLVDVGCCGMAGTYGHETPNVEVSKHIYSLSWDKVIETSENSQQLLISGFSCRSQVKRVSNKKVLSPLQALLRHCKE